MVIRQSSSLTHIVSDTDIEIIRLTGSNISYIRSRNVLSTTYCQHVPEQVIRQINMLYDNTISCKMLKIGSNIKIVRLIRNQHGQVDFSPLYCNK